MLQDHLGDLRSQMGRADELAYEVTRSLQNDLIGSFCNEPF